MIGRGDKHDTNKFERAREALNTFTWDPVTTLTSFFRMKVQFSPGRDLPWSWIYLYSPTMRFALCKQQKHSQQHTQQHIDLKAKGRIDVAFCLSSLLYRSKIWACGKIFSITFMNSIIDSLFDTLFHLPVFFSALPFSSSTHITIIDFLDRQAASPGYH
jgi:hypothetical protein